MADPATQFQPAGLNIGYQYQPTVTRLNPPIPLQAADYGQIGKAALASAGQVFQTLMQSPLNPEVKEKMKLGIDAAKRGQETIDWARAQGPLGYMLGGVGPGGYEQQPAMAAGPTVQAQLLADQVRKQKDQNPPPVPPNDLGGTDTGDQGYSDSEAARRTAPTKAPPANPADLLRQPPTASIYSPFRSPLAAAAPGPASFQGPSPDQTAQAAPPQQGPADQGSVISQVTQQPGVALADWQAQNAHPVMASGDALNWAKNFDTGAQRATYLPHGGPQGEPAYAFHMKGGGVNTVPISQIVKNGGAPLVAGQNTSATLSTSDAIMNQQPPGQQPPGQPPGQPPTAPGQPYQPVDYRTAAEQAQPPGAYNPQPYQAGVAQAAQQPGALTAQATPQAGARTDVTPTPTPPPPPVAPGADAAAAEAELDKKTPRKTPDPGTGDPYVGDWGGMRWFQNNDPAIGGRYYTALPSPTSTLNQQRFYLGSTGYVDMPMKESVLRQQLRNLRDNTPGISLSDEETKTMPVDQVKNWLNIGKLYHATGGDPTGATEQRLDAQTETSKSIQRLIDMVQAAKDAHIDPKELNLGQEEQSIEAAKRDALLPPHGVRPLWPAGVPWGLGGANPGDLWNAAIAGYHDIRAGFGTVHPLVDAMTQEVKYLTGQMQQTPGLQYTPEGKPENAGIPVSAGWGGAGASTRIPLPTDVSPLQQVNRIFQGGNPELVLDGLKQLKSRTDHAYQDSIQTAGGLNFRVPVRHLQNAQALAKGENLADSDNTFRDAKGNLRIPPALMPPSTEKSATPATPAPTPAPPPQPSAARAPKIANDDDFDRLPHNTNFYDPNGVLRHKD